MANYTIEETRQVKVLLNQLRGFQNTLQSIIGNKEAVEHSRYVSFRDMVYIYNHFAKQAEFLLKNPAMFYLFNTENMRGYMDTLWGEQKRILEQVLVSTQILYAALEGNVDFADDEFDNLENFIKSRLRTVVFDRPQKEKEVQNAIESLLLGRGLGKGVDYDRETGKFMFSGKEYIPDFIVPKLHLCIEVKLLREGKKSQIIEEINADITAYGKQYERQLFIVYDLGYIQNEDEFRRDIENAGEIKVIVVKH